MDKLGRHWTEESTDDFLYRIAADFIRQIERVMEVTGVNQAELARRLGVSEGRVSQVLNNPGNVTLRKIVEYVRALGCKVAIVEYDDSDPENRNGPVDSEIFAKCWYRAGVPADFFALEGAVANSVTYAAVGHPLTTLFTQEKFRDNAANTRSAVPADESLADNAKTLEMRAPIF